MRSVCVETGTVVSPCISLRSQFRMEDTKHFVEVFVVILLQLCSVDGG